MTTEDNSFPACGESEQTSQPPLSTKTISTNFTIPQTTFSDATPSAESSSLFSFTEDFLTHRAVSSELTYSDDLSISSTDPTDASDHLAIPEGGMVYDGSGLVGISEEGCADDCWEDLPVECAYELDLDSVLEGTLPINNYLPQIPGIHVSLPSISPA